jgi:hypothetical protein
MMAGPITTFAVGGQMSGQTAIKQAERQPLIALGNSGGQEQTAVQNSDRRLTNVCPLFVRFFSPSAFGFGWFVDIARDLLGPIPTCMKGYLMGCYGIDKLVPEVYESRT